MIEDPQTSFWSPNNAFDVLPDESNSTFRILKEMKTAGVLKSTYLSEDQLEYLRDNIRSCELYAHSNERQHSTSMIQKI